MRSFTNFILVLTTTVLVGGCAITPPTADPTYTAPPSWVASPPANSAIAVQRLSDWWAQFDDPQLDRLISQAQTSSASLAAAQARIAQARAGLSVARGALLPSATFNASTTRAGNPAGVSTSSGASTDALWELDLWGANRNSVSSAAARLGGAEALWHDARISLAAEVATVYTSLRACEATLVVLEQDAASLRDTARLTQLKVNVGFEAPANGALTDASAADGTNRVVSQQTECAALAKALVQLTGEAETALLTALKPNAARIAQPKGFVVASLPANALAQRPDLAAAAREIVGAAADVAVAEANRYPRISLLGSIGISALRAGGATADGTTWSLGPALSLPLFDAGRRKAGQDQADARLLELQANFSARASNAVREVEEALLRLDSSTRRLADAERSAKGFSDFFAAAQTRWKVGVGSVLEQEDARRVALNANAALINLRRERVQAWINLYKAVGGGWSAENATP
jgi:outer membrane protein, multidrug efflux system